LLERPFQTYEAWWRPRTGFDRFGWLRIPSSLGDREIGHRRERVERFGQSGAIDAGAKDRFGQAELLPFFTGRFNDAPDDQADSETCAFSTPQAKKLNPSDTLVTKDTRSRRMAANESCAPIAARAVMIATTD
jgi:hypothetical protein